MEQQQQQQLMNSTKAPFSMRDIVLDLIESVMKTDQEWLSERVAVAELQLP